MAVDLGKEQRASLARPRCRYSLAAKLFYLSMDLLAGKKTTLAKVKLIEMLAVIPYRAWEFRHYALLTRRHGDPARENAAREIIAWCRAAQDNEHWHLRVVHEKMKEDGCRSPWYLSAFFTVPATALYGLFCRWLARLSLRRAFLFNAEFEDHAEHAYAQFVQEHPEWERQPPASDRVKAYADLPTWADVFRRIGLDERDHMNRSFTYGGRPQRVVEQREE